MPDQVSTSGGAIRRTSLRMLLASVAVLALLFGSLSFIATSAVAQGDAATPQAQASPAVATPVSPGATGCDALSPGVGSESWVQTELYFGTTKPDGTELTDDEFNTFLDNEITPRFPDGLTVLTGYGQWRNAAGEATSEKSIVVIILYPADPSGETSARIQEIRETYKTQFDQESVLRADTPAVCVSF